MIKPREYLSGKYHYTVDLMFDWFGISSMTTDNFCFYFQNRLIQTSKTGGQWYSDTCPFSIPWTTFPSNKQAKSGNLYNKRLTQRGVSAFK